MIPDYSTSSSPRTSSSTWAPTHLSYRHLFFSFVIVESLRSSWAGNDASRKAASFLTWWKRMPFRWKSTKWTHLCTYFPWRQGQQMPDLSSIFFRRKSGSPAEKWFVARGNGKAISKKSDAAMTRRCYCKKRRKSLYSIVNSTSYNMRIGSCKLGSIQRLITNCTLLTSLCSAPSSTRGSSRAPPSVIELNYQNLTALREIPLWRFHC